MTNNKTAIAVSNVSVSYGANIILENVSVNVPQHAIMAIIGPNGSGKTTLLKTLLGLITPQSGEVSVFGGTPEEMRDRVAYVPQRFAFDQTMPITVSEFLHLSVIDATHTNQMEALAHFKIEMLEKSLLGELSGGQLQRVLLARAFLQEPDILYLDEPEAGIDIGGEQDFYDLIEHLHQKHDMTIILVSHEIDIVSQRATHVLCLNRNHVCFGEPHTALKPEVLKDLYGTDINFFNHHKK